MTTVQSARIIWGQIINDLQETLQLWVYKGSIISLYSKIEGEMFKVATLDKDGFSTIPLEQGTKLYVLSSDEIGPIYIQLGKSDFHHGFHYIPLTWV